MKKSVLKWLAGDNKPDALGWTRFDPARVQEMDAAFEIARKLEEQQRKEKKA
jgi:hypothetical protein